MARWYIVDGANHPTATLDAPDRPTAEAMAHGLGQGVGVISVCEYEVIQEEIIAKAKKERWARKRAWDAVYLDYLSKGERKPDEPEMLEVLKRIAWARGELEAHLRGEVAA